MIVIGRCELISHCGFNLHFSETIKLLEGNIGSKSSDIAFSNFCDISPWARETKEKMNKWDYIKLKVLHNKGNHQQDEKTAN